MNRRTMRQATTGLAAVLISLAANGPVTSVFAQEEESAPAFDGEWRYQVSCAGCHGEEGEGISAFGPPMRGNALVMNSPPEPLIRVIQDGRFNRSRAYLEYAGMPAFPKIRAGEALALINYMKTALQEE